MKLQPIPDSAGLPGRTLPPDEQTALVGRSAAVIVSAAGSDAVFLDGQEVLRNLALCDALPLTVTQYLVLVERAFANGVQERLFVPLKQAGVAWSWNATQPTELNVEWVWQSQAATPGKSRGASVEVGSIILLCDRVVTWESTEANGRLTARLDAGEALTLVLTDRAAKPANSLRAFENLPALVRSRIADAQRARQEHLTVSTATDWAERVNAAVYALHSAVDAGRVIDAGADGPIWLRSAAQTVADFTDTLGFAPDPEKHRVVLAPKLPADWTTLEVRNLRIGAADAFAFRYDRSGSRHTFVLSPEAGAVPPRLVFEPAIAAQRISSVSVDGVVAELNYRRAGDRIVCPLQIVLDHARTVVIDAEPSA